MTAQAGRAGPPRVNFSGPRTVLLGVGTLRRGGQRSRSADDPDEVVPARELARAGYPDPVQPVTAQELAQACIDAARRQAAASKADGKHPPTQR